MERTIFDDKKINKSNFYENKKLFNTYDIEVDKTLISKREPYDKKSSFKYFIGYNDDDAIRPLCMKLRQWLDMLSILMVIRQCLLKLMMVAFSEKCK